jgi:hypothetical protein
LETTSATIVAFNQNLAMHHISARGFEILKLVGVLLLFTGCYVNFPAPAPTSDHNFAVEDLLIDAAAFPDGWVSGQPFEIARPVVGEAEGWERVARTFYGHTTIADQSIYGYQDEAEASKAFGRWLDRAFSSNEFIPAWEPSPELLFQSSYANQLHLACAQTTSNFVCQCLAQYGEYIVRFYVPMEPRTNVTYTEFDRILQVTEEHLVSNLKLERHKP